MKYMTLVITLGLVAGCGTTQMVERSLDDAGIKDVGRLCSNTCLATLSYSTHFEVHEPVDEDSLYKRLQGGEITLRLSDSRELQGRVGRLPSHPEKWVIGQVSKDASAVDTVQFRFSSIEAASVAGNIQAKDLRLEPDLILVDERLSLPISSFNEIVISQSRQVRSRGVGAGLGLGALSGAAIGALVGAAVWRECTCEGFECFGCIGNPESRGTAAGAGALVGGVIGGVTGLLVGAITGTRENTIYRFRPDTSQQMSVVIGVGPSTCAGGGAR